MPRLPRRYTLRQKSPNAPPRIRGALREISEPLTTIVDFDWDSYNAGCQKLIGVIKSSKASVREPTESGSGSPETKGQSIVMAEISYPVDADGCYVGYISEEQLAVLVPILSEGLQREIFASSRFPQLLLRVP